MPAPLGWKPILHVVKCIDCDLRLLRVHYKTKHRCDLCKKQHHLKLQYARKKTWGTQARRYRIIMHVLGWEDSEFAEALLEMKRSPMSFREHPENRNAQFDENTEKRKKRREKSRRKHAEESSGSSSRDTGSRAVRGGGLLPRPTRSTESQEDLHQVPKGRSQDSTGKDLHDLQKDGG